MPPSGSYRQSPAAAGAAQTSGEVWSAQISSLVSTADIPSTSDLRSLSKLMKDRNRQLERRLSNLSNDRRSVSTGKIHAIEQKKLSLDVRLDQDRHSASGSAARQSPGLARRDRLTPSSGGPSTTIANDKAAKSRSGTHSSPPPVVGIASPSANDGQRTRIKVKHEIDREREHSIEAHSVASGALAGSPGLEADWDDDGPARPGRTYLNKRKRHHANGDSPGADETANASDADVSKAQSDSKETITDNRDSGDLSRRDSILSTAASSAFKLKLNPTAQPAFRRDNLPSGLLRRQSNMRAGEISHLPLTPFQIQQAAMWELPKRTPEAFIPKLAEPKPLRTYATKPDQVDVDFASSDWRERDRERDRIDAATAAGTPTGPGPGQAMVKESAMSRARDRKQEQVAFHTFQQWCDGWFRTLTEEDLAWLSSKSEDLEPFSIPSLGRHYKEVWEEEEANGALTSTIYQPNAPYITAPLTHPLGTGAHPASRLSHTASNGASSAVNVDLSKTPKFDPRHLKDDHLFAGSLEDVRSGPFTERLLAALLPTPPPSEPDGSQMQANGQAASGTGGLVLINGHGGGSAGVSQDMSDYEDRLMRELKAIDVLANEEHVDWSERTDDEISSTLRKIQRLLHKQVRTNEMRKARLFEVAMDRMAYQDYAACLTSVEREIEAGWMRRQTQIRKSMQAQKKKKGGGSSSSNSAAANGSSGSAVAAAAAIGADASAGAAASPAAGTPGGAGGTAMTAQASTHGVMSESRGGGPIKPQFTEALIGAMRKRQQLQYAFEPMFVERPLARFTPSAEQSIFEDLDLS